MKSFKVGDILTGDPSANKYGITNTHTIVKVLKIRFDGVIKVKVIDVVNSDSSAFKEHFSKYIGEEYDVLSKYFIKVASPSLEWD